MWRAVLTAFPGRGPPAWPAVARCFASRASPLKHATRALNGDTELPVVAIVGRPNVGKSALFNRLVGRRQALVLDTPSGHVTRDWKEGRAALGDLRFTVVDTSGLEPERAARDPASIQARGAALTASVLARADATVFLVDARTGVMPGDVELAKWLRRLPPPHRVLLVANKCERPAASAAGLAECTQLGFGPGIAISAETGDGMADLYAGLQPLVDAAVEEREGEETKIGDDGGGRSIEAEGVSTPAPPELLRLAIVGLPNVGKSTLCNTLLQSERCLTGPEPGLTRDAVRAKFEHQGQRFELVDTAGWVRKTRLAAHDPDAGGVLTQRALAEGAAAMQGAHVVIQLVDGHRALELGQGLTHRELMLANEVISHGRALLLGVNKMDLLGPRDREAVLQLLRRSIDRGLPAGSSIWLLPLAALTGRVQDLLPAARDIYALWNLRVSTGRLNRLLARVQAAHTSGGGSEVGRVKYLLQAKGRPPTFVAWVGGSAPMTVATQNFLIRCLREEIGLEGVPIRLKVRTKERRGRR